MQEAATEFQQFVESQTEDESEDAESRQREARRQANIAIDRQGIIDWGTDAVIRPDPARFGLSQSESTWPDISTLPCCRAYGGIAMALVRKAHANNRKHTEADDYDTMHYVLSAMADAFVTADVSLRSTIGLIEWGRVPALSPEQLCETINGH
jgi:hypothetical protein